LRTIGSKWRKPPNTTRFSCDSLPSLSLLRRRSLPFAPGRGLRRVCAWM
jgi:hypothetical protein